MNEYLDKLSGKETQNLVAKLEDPFKKLPHLPEGLVNFLVSIAPWLTGLGGLLSILGGISNLTTQGATMGWMAAYVQINPTYFIISGIISILIGVLYLMAFSPLQKRQLKGWFYLFWAYVLGLVDSLAAVAFGMSGLVGLVIGALIGLYILFELKPKYSVAGKSEAKEEKK